MQCITLMYKIWKIASTCLMHLIYTHKLNNMMSWIHMEMFYVSKKLTSTFWGHFFGAFSHSLSPVPSIFQPHCSRTVFSQIYIFNLAFFNNYLKLQATRKSPGAPEKPVNASLWSLWTYISLSPTSVLTVWVYVFEEKWIKLSESSYSDLFASVLIMAAQ